jgi:hypothetical protein
MPIKRIPFTEWKPDQPSIADTLLDANNVIPSTSGYLPFPSAVNFSNAASENINNIMVGKFNTSTQLFAGGATKLFKFNGTTLDLENKSKTGGYTGTGRWSFTQFGSVVLAANNSEKIQAWTVNSSSLFADVSADAPICKYVTVVRDFVVAANISGTSNKLQWSNINEETNWTSGAASQADYQIIPEGGNIVAVTGGEFGLVLLEHALVRMSYIGSPLFFQFDTISSNLGCVDNGSVAQYAGMTYFLSDDGFYSCDGKSIVPIGAEKIDKYFYANLNISNVSTISSTIDPVRKIVVWNYPTISGGRELLIYNWQIQRWSRCETTSSYLGAAASSGFTLENIGTLYPSIELVPASLDSRIWTGGKYILAGTKDTKIITFNGDNTTASLVTSDIEQGYNSVVTLARPIVDNGAGIVAVASRRELNDVITYNTPASSGEGTRVSLRSAGRYHRLNVVPTGAWTTAIGVDVNIESQGDR